MELSAQKTWNLVTARKRSLRRLCFYWCVSTREGVCYPSMHCSFFLGGSGWGGVSRPTAKGEVEGDLVQAHSQGGS